jgi:hypothetical protein
MVTLIASAPSFPYANQASMCPKYVFLSTILDHTFVLEDDAIGSDDACSLEARFLFFNDIHVGGEWLH